ncbi:hypothetical protein UPYG_G00151640 [Umbra pygmaea]|uniref:Uncharacterized protein n=1 Tax=Umbra pygmaea TaxID=75934 RepID=A0ABD0XJQ2_UMBPY
MFHGFDEYSPSIGRAALGCVSLDSLAGFVVFVCDGGSTGRGNLIGFSHLLCPFLCITPERICWQTSQTTGFMPSEVEFDLCDLLDYPEDGQHIKCLHSAASLKG